MSSPSRTRRRRLLRELAACPDCGSSVRVIRDAPGSPLLEVHHDPTCPIWRAQGSLPFRQLRVLPIGVQ